MSIIGKNLKSIMDKLNGSQVMAFLDQFSPQSAKIISIIYNWVKLSIIGKKV